MHRVVNLTSVGVNAEAIESLKLEIREILAENGVHEAQVNDGTNEAGDPTLAVAVDFNSATRANEFHAWLKQLITTNSDQFKSARTRVHDCFHAANQNMPCQIGDVWELKKNE